MVKKIMIIIPGKNDGRKRPTSDIPTENLGSTGI